MSKKVNNLNKLNKNTIKELSIYILSFIIPAFIYFMILWKQKFIPNGTKTVLFMDLKDQYTAFLASLRHIFDSDNNLLFNWSRSMGGNVFGLYAYYSGGPLSLITCLFPVSKMYLAIELLEIIEIGLAGLTCSIFFNRGVSKNKNDFAVIIFSLSYALMSYNMVYTSCYMWLEGLIILPLILLGIERIFEGKKGGLFYFSLCYSMISNYYTAYMICLFSVFYVILRLAAFLEKGKDKKELGVYIGKYVGLAMLSALTAFPVLFCVYKDLSSGKLYNNTNTVEAKELFQFSKLFTKFLNGKYDSIALEGLPSVYCGILMLVFAVIFFIFIKKCILERIIAALIIVLMLFSFWQNKLDVIWHGFQKPNWFPWRYAFLFSFFLIYLAYRAYLDLDSICKKVSKKIGENADKNADKKADKKTDKESANKDVKTVGKVAYTCVITILLIVSSLDMYLNGAALVKGLENQFGYADKTEYDAFMDKTLPLVNEIKKDKSMYRVASEKVLSMNDAMLLNYNGLTHYSSTYNASINNITKKMGYAQGWFWNSGDGVSPVTDALFNVKYRMFSGEMPKEYSFLKENKGLLLYENKNVLPLVYAANSAAMEVKAESEDVFLNQNTVLSSLVGENKNYYVAAENTSANSYVAKVTGPMFAYFVSDGSEAGSIVINNSKTINTEEPEREIYLGDFKEGETVNLDIRLNNATYRSLYVYSLSEEMFKTDIKSLNEHSMKITGHKGGKLKGNIDIGDNELIVTSIPYDTGFIIKVDGKKIKYEKYLDSFIAFHASSGSHDILISYIPSGFIMGLIISLIAIIIFILYIRGMNLKKLKKIFKE